MSGYQDWRIEDFPFQIDIPTRWGDNDMLGHLNNVVYNRMIETVVVHFTMGPLQVNWNTDQSYPVVVESLCRFHRSLSFPATITAGLRAGRIGSTSVTYEIALFDEEGGAPAATGHFVHVFIDRDSQKSIFITDQVRTLIEAKGVKT